MTDALRTAKFQEAIAAFEHIAEAMPHDDPMRAVPHAQRGLAALRAALAAQPQGEPAKRCAWPDCPHGADCVHAVAAPAPQPQGAQHDVDPLWPVDGLYPDMQPPVTSRDRWMFDQGRLAERRQGAQRVAQPLTQERIAQLAEDAGLVTGENMRRDGYMLYRSIGERFNVRSDHLTALVRAVEAEVMKGHGIGEQA